MLGLNEYKIPFKQRKIINNFQIFFLLRVRLHMKPPKFLHVYAHPYTRKRIKFKNYYSWLKFGCFFNHFALICRGGCFMRYANRKSAEKYQVNDCRSLSSSSSLKVYSKCFVLTEPSIESIESEKIHWNGQTEPLNMHTFK